MERGVGYIEGWCDAEDRIAHALRAAGWMGRLALWLLGVSGREESW